MQWNYWMLHNHEKLEAPFPILFKHDSCYIQLDRYRTKFWSTKKGHSDNQRIQNKRYNRTSTVQHSSAAEKEHLND